MSIKCSAYSDDQAAKRGAHACVPCSDYEYRTVESKSPAMARNGLRHLFEHRALEVGQALTSDLPLVWITTYKVMQILNYYNISKAAATQLATT